MTAAHRVSQSWPSRLATLLEWLPLAVWRERRQARRASLALLEIYHRIAAESPELTGVGRYERIVVERTGLDVSTARVLVQRAEESFAEWPVERPLIFRDVVQYLVMQEHLASAPGVAGARSALGDVVATVVPSDL
jgi:hypothetical protein